MRLHDPAVAGVVPQIGLSLGGVDQLDRPAQLRRGHFRAPRARGRAMPSPGPSRRARHSPRAGGRDRPAGRATPRSRRAGAAGCRVRSHSGRGSRAPAAGWAKRGRRDPRGPGRVHAAAARRVRSPGGGRHRRPPRAIGRWRPDRRAAPGRAAASAPARAAWCRPPTGCPPPPPGDPGWPPGRGPCGPRRARLAAAAERAIIVVQQLHQRRLHRMGVADAARFQHSGEGAAALLVDGVQHVIGDVLGDEGGEGGPRLDAGLQPL